MRISVTKRHIAEAKCGAAQKCMVAMAIRTAYPDIKFVSVRTNGITVRRKKGEASFREHWQVPLNAARAIVAFDRKEAVKPFVFTPKLIDRVPVVLASPQVRKQRVASSAANKRKRQSAGLPTQDAKHLFRYRVAGL